jgi:UDPglucose 6-dehydrogenase
MAEFIKYSSNALLSNLISFSNELSIIANSIGDINIKKSFEILHKDKRWSNKNGQMSSYFYPGCGFGGYCLPKDLEAISNIAKNYSVPSLMLDSMIQVNKSMSHFALYKLKKIITDKNTKISILGLSFKPESDDVRDSPSHRIVKLILENNYTNISAYDPIANTSFQNLYPELNVKYHNSLEDCVNKAKVIMILTAWSEFKEIQKYGLPIIDLRYML